MSFARISNAESHPRCEIALWTNSVEVRHTCEKRPPGAWSGCRGPPT